MGSSTLIDIIGSFVVGGIIFLIAMRLNVSSSENYYAYYADFILQSNLTTLVTIIEDDFSRIGYCANPTRLPNASMAIRIADSSRLRFFTDFVDKEGGSDGNLDTIEYYIGPTSELLDTPNPNDRYLYRRLNNSIPMRINFGITEFKLRYLRSDNEREIRPLPVADPTQIGIIELSIKLESPVATKRREFSFDTSRYEVYWQQMRLVSKTMQNR